MPNLNELLTAVADRAREEETRALEETLTRLVEEAEIEAADWSSLPRRAPALACAEDGTALV